MSSELDKDMLATLTDEERAAIESDDLSEEERAALKNIVGDDNDDDEDDDEDGEGEEGGAPVEGKAAKEPPPEETGEPAAKADPAPAEVPAAAPTEAKLQPGYQSNLPDDYDAKLTSLKERDAELRQRFKDGEIDIDERDAGLAALAEEREGLLVARTKAEIASEMRAQQAEQQWRNTINTFMARVAEQEGIDYSKDAARLDDFDNFVKTLGRKPENADKPMEWFLVEAHKRVNALYGSPMPAPPSKQEATAKRKPDLQAVPKTLAQVPGSDGPGDVGSEFAEVDQLEGDDLEAAIARMSPAQKAKYAMGG